ncbi:hypothetical protein T484DRAFT_1793682, partial [Baffinella frigidus]
MLDDTSAADLLLPARIDFGSPLPERLPEREGKGRSEQDAMVERRVGEIVGEREREREWQRERVKVREREREREWAGMMRVVLQGLEDAQREADIMVGEQLDAQAKSGDDAQARSAEQRVHAGRRGGAAEVRGEEDGGDEDGGGGGVQEVSFKLFGLGGTPGGGGVSLEVTGGGREEGGKRGGKDKEAKREKRARLKEEVAAGRRREEALLAQVERLSVQAPPHPPSRATPATPPHAHTPPRPTPLTPPRSPTHIHMQAAATAPSPPYRGTPPSPSSSPALGDLSSFHSWPAPAGDAAPPSPYASWRVPSGEDAIPGVHEFLSARPSGEDATMRGAHEVEKCGAAALLVGVATERSRSRAEL